MPKTKEINPYAAKENAGPHTLHHFGGRAPSPRDGPFSVFAPSTTTTGSTIASTLPSPRDSAPPSEASVDALSLIHI